jgi:hemoglobin
MSESTITSAETSQAETSQWERVGGEAAVKELIDRFYEDVLDEPQLAGFFDGVDVDDLKPHFAEVLKVVLGGPGAQTGLDLEEYLTEAHSGLGVSDSDYALTVEVLVEVLGESDVPEDIVETIAAALETMAPYVVSAPPENIAL